MLCRIINSINVKEIPLQQISPLRRLVNRTRRQEKCKFNCFYISYSYLTEPYDLRTDFFPLDSVFQRPYAPPQRVAYYLPDSQREILSVPSINKINVTFINK
jgi:hypothetical protein